MWTVLKIEKNKLEFLKRELQKKLNNELNFYIPKFFSEKYLKNKLTRKELNLLGDYVFCYHKKFSDANIINDLKFTKGLKYFLDGFKKSQSEIKNFIQKCKEAENEKGYLTHSFLEIVKNNKYKFSTGPFSQLIFNVVNLQQEKLDIFLGNLKTTVKRDKYFISSL